MSKLSKFIQAFFWFAFAAFLGASIAHITYFFRAFEPQGQGNDLLWWGVSLAIALSIDVTIFLLSVTVANLHRSKRAGGLIASVWMFIFALAVLSFYINFKYAQHFASPSMITPTAFSIPRVGTIGDINPFIASMFQILAIAYTWIADKIVSDEKPKSAQELKIEADELEQIAQEKVRIAAIKRGMKEETGGFIGSLGNGIRRAKREVTNIINDGKDAVIPALTGEQNGPIDAGINESYQDDTQVQNEPLPGSYEQVKTDDTRVQNEPIAAPIMEVKEDDSPGNTGPLMTLTPDVLILVRAYDKLGALLATSRKTVTYNEVSEALNVSIKLVTNRVKDGVLKTSPRNDKLITIKSVCELAKMLHTQKQNESKTGGLPALKLVQNISKQEPITDTSESVNAGEQEPITDDIPAFKAPELGMIEQAMYDALLQNESTLSELKELTRGMDNDEVTAFLKQRYSEYAHYITPERVERVMQYIACEETLSIVNAGERAS